MPYDATVPTEGEDRRRNPDPLHQAQVEQLFSLKEWMVAISGKLDRLETKLDGKADIQHVQSLELRTFTLERQMIEGQAKGEYLLPQHARMLEDVGTLKEKSAAIQSVDTYKRWVWGTAFMSMTALVASVLGAFLHN